MRTGMGIRMRLHLKVQGAEESDRSVTFVRLEKPCAQSHWGLHPSVIWRKGSRAVCDVPHPLQNPHEVQAPL